MQNKKKIFLKKKKLKKSKNFNKIKKKKINKKNLISLENKIIYIPKYISISDIAEKTLITSSKIIKFLIKSGKIITKNEILDQKTAINLIQKLGLKAEKYIKNKKKKNNFKKNKKNFILRAPIVTIMGHVNHGKTSLLDYIRKTKITNFEIGGITQNIGAYHIKFNKKNITFIDTPGHEAFSSIRTKGIKITDIIVLLVAADDGVMPQTREIISQILPTKIPIIVAISKIDKIDINLKKIYEELIREKIIPEKYGGNIPFIKISIKTGKGIKTLLEYILLQAEIMELKTTISTPAKGVIINSKLDKGNGPIATILVKSGILKIGDFILTDTTYGKIKSILNENFKKLDKVKPSIPVEIYGLKKIPNIIENFHVTKKKIKKNFFLKQKKNKIINFEDTKKKKISLILKTNLQSHKEVLIQNIKKLSNDEININIIHSAIGEISENDINLAIISKSKILGFNTKINLKAKKLAKKNNIYVKQYNIIYEIIEEIKNLILKIKEKFKIKKIIGIVEIRQIFNNNKKFFIAGCYVKKGEIKKESLIKLTRNNKTIFIGKIETLKRFKKNVQIVKKGFECGISLKNFKDIKINDLIEIIKI
ncbi:translation initiation factor IF-2 [Candidatus Zinderia endosymbiont of Aphrophora alni]|uniref:translation initiation factor IF-2 n=1 Tax=Candidatus Zinderia endosymbiont of Aphrophora alni TaxID=3077951 RepID=UPI0030D24FA5